MQFTRVAVVLASAALAAALSGCTANGTGAAAPKQSTWTEQPTTAATSGADPGSFDASGTAQNNQAAFDAAIRKVLAGNANADGNSVVAALKATGFPMGATQVTASTTSANLQPGSIMVGVKIGDQCLVGQWGTAVDGYQSSVAPVLRSGGCLIGGIPVVG